MDTTRIAMPQTHSRHLSLEELLNSITHGIGLALSIAGFVVLLVLAVSRGSVWQIASCAIYGTTLVVLYAASTLYHGIPAPTLKRVFRILDHSAIYLLIAGTYTPFLLVNLRGTVGWTLFAIVWTLAFAGILFKFWFVDRLPIVSTLVYLLMGWLALAAIKPLIAGVPHSGLAWLLAGGALYSFGVVFYASKKIPYAHAIWHVFVMAGSICHYVAVVVCVLVPAKS
jgi:hemolysin III